MGPAALPLPLLLLPPDGGQLALMSTGRSSPGLAMATLTAAMAKQQGSKLYHTSTTCVLAVQRCQ
jgi:hypothetical protein